MGKLVSTMQDAAPGDWKFGTYYSDADDAKPAYLIYKCPCGCGGNGALQLRGPHARDVKEPERPQWEWDGNREAPTLQPSILHWNTDDAGARTTQHWHGYLRGGVFESC